MAVNQQLPLPLPSQDWWLVSFTSENGIDARYRVLRGGVLHVSTRQQYIASTGDLCGGRGCEVCRM